ncbi:MAG: type II toxin-antitoxin system RelB/DinJ family antitoxin [Candidatus Saccharimonadales bacterium]
MKTAILNVKIDEQVKKQAQAVASSFGIPLSTLVNAYLMELAETGQIHFSAVEVMTPQMEKIIGKAEKEIKAGDTVGPFNTAEEAVNYLKKL